jgi:hypothetical protein
MYGAFTTPSDHQTSTQHLLPRSQRRRSLFRLPRRHQRALKRAHRLSVTDEHLYARPLATFGGDFAFWKNFGDNRINAKLTCYRVSRRCRP